MKTIDRISTAQGRAFDRIEATQSRFLEANERAGKFYEEIRPPFRNATAGARERVSSIVHDTKDRLPSRSDSSVPSPKEIVNNYFDAASKFAAMNRKFVNELLDVWTVAPSKASPVKRSTKPVTKSKASSSKVS